MKMGTLMCHTGSNYRENNTHDQGNKGANNLQLRELESMKREVAELVLRPLKKGHCLHGTGVFDLGGLWSWHPDLNEERPAGMCRLVSVIA